MASYGSQGNRFKRAGKNGGVAVSGFAQIQRGLASIEGGAKSEVRKRFVEVGGYVKTRAAANVTHKTGRHVGIPSIEDGLKISVLQKGVSIYTTAPHGGVQNVGAWTRQGRGPHVSRKNASRYMDRAVKQSAPFVERETQAVIDWALKSFERG